jgi:hypothetical protein
MKEYDFDVLNDGDGAAILAELKAAFRQECVDNELSEEEIEQCMLDNERSLMFEACDLLEEKLKQAERDGDFDPIY